jgi:hypothetical protein
MLEREVKSGSMVELALDRYAPQGTSMTVICVVSSITAGLPDEGGRST